MDNSLPAGQQSSFFGQKVSIPGISVNSAGDNQLILKDNYSSRIYYNSNGVPTILLGLRTSVTPNEQGLYVSQDGIDVTQATDSQLIFNSNQEILNIITQGFVGVSSASVGGGLTATRSASISYTLPQSYNPVILTYTTIPGGATYAWQGIVPLGFAVGAGSGVTIEILDFLNLTVTTTGATFSAECYNGSNATFTAPSYLIAYYVLQQQAQ